jgi:hypothetical protein
MTSSPAYSPCDPALGCRDMAANPVISASQASSCVNSSAYPLAWSAGAKGCSSANSRQVTGSISEVALSFIVHDPRGIIEVVSERSRACRRWM